MNPKDEGGMTAQVSVHYPMLYGCAKRGGREVGSKAP